ncbi:MAG: hypothetical protein H2060_01800 [Azoarcus sp.]|nr:hypothetical protein [Azoarcus sp.]
MQRGLSVVGGFFVRAIVWLVPSLALWFWARDWLVAPVAWLVERVMLFWFSVWVYGTELAGTEQTLLTTVQVPHPSGRAAELLVDTNVLMYCYGLPMLLALLLASRAHGIWWKLPAGALAMWPLQAWGVVFDFLIKVGAHYAQFSTPITGFTPFQVDLFGVAYQLGYLVLPTLAPVMLWLLFERRFIGMVMFDAALDGATRSR